MAAFDLPYFDEIIARLEQQPDSGLAEAFRRHVHWGYFASPAAADDSLRGYLVAAEELTARVCQAGGVRSGQRILDVGCGFGGTVDHLSERLENCAIAGLNIDARQLARARRSVLPRRGHALEFIQADAGRLPFAAGAFDVVLAVECIFHLDSRKEFFREVARVLKPTGTFALTDFVLREGVLLELGKWMSSTAPPQSRFYGPSKNIAPTSKGYQRLGRSSGLGHMIDLDITAHTLPTYPSMRRLYREAGMGEGEAATNYLEAMAQKGFVEYHILSFARPTAP